MKRFFAMLLAMAMLGTTAYAAETKTAIPVQQEVELDGHTEIMKGYNIDGNTYFRLRDIAQEVTEHITWDSKHFGVLYDAEKRGISLISWYNYTPIEGAEPYAVGAEAKQAVLSDMPVWFGGEDVSASGKCKGYNVDGYTFYKLRDIAGLIDLGVEWCEEEGMISLSSPEPVLDEDGNPVFPVAARKPVIYLYPEETTEVSVKVDCDLTVTYPAYGDGWEVTAEPDGTLTNHADGKEYSYLFWEGESYGEMDFSEGFVVKGEATAAFLQETLAEMGLTPKEYNECIVYWLPYMQDNPYNLISFQWENYDASAKLEISPVPDNILRVFLAFRPLEEFVEIPAQSLPHLEREGFTVVEWGGTEIS